MCLLFLSCTATKKEKRTGIWKNALGRSYNSLLSVKHESLLCVCVCVDPVNLRVKLKRKKKSFQALAVFGTTNKPQARSDC